MIEISLDHFDIKQIAESGQCFRWKVLGESAAEIIAFDRILTIERKGDKLLLDCSEEDFKNIWQQYFDLDTDYSQIERLIAESGDAHLKKAYSRGSGIRILRQELFETTVTFLISQNNNIPRIKKSLELICEKGGFKLINSDRGYRLPKPSEVSPEFFLDRSLGLGYRNVYLYELYEFINENPSWLSELQSMDYVTARKELLKRKGIGPKVADCICLFSLHHIDAFPIDTHVKQLLDKYYKGNFDYEHYKGFAGIIQQYLFYEELLS